VEHWARDVTTNPDNTVTYGEPYFLYSEEIDTGPTAGIGNLPCETYDGTNW
jgi:hypothetical protein